VVVRDGVVEKEYRYKLVGRYGKVGYLTPIVPYHIKRPHPKPATHSHGGGTLAAPPEDGRVHLVVYCPHLSSLDYRVNIMCSTEPHWLIPLYHDYSTVSSGD